MDNTTTKVLRGMIDAKNDRLRLMAKKMDILKLRMEMQSKELLRMKYLLEDAQEPDFELQQFLPDVFTD